MVMSAVSSVTTPGVFDTSTPRWRALAMSIWLMASFETGESGFQFVSKHSWIEQWGISWHLGVDGIFAELKANLLPGTSAESDLGSEWGGYGKDNGRT